jgi:hypothetical protein
VQGREGEGMMSLRSGAQAGSTAGRGARDPWLVRDDGATLRQPQEWATLTDLPKSILDDPRYRSIRERREKYAAEARQAQARYRRLTKGFIAASLAAAVVGGLVLYGIDLTPRTDGPERPGAALHGLVSDQNVRPFLLFLQAIAVGAAGFFAYVLNAQDFARTWCDYRARAEELRQQSALLALEIGHAQGPEEFRAAGRSFVVDLAEGQIAYLARAAASHGTRSIRLSVLGGAIIAIGVAAPILATAGLPSLVLVGALAAIVTPALLSGLKSWSEATAGVERKRLHDATFDLLQAARARQGELDAAIGAHDLEAAKAYAGLVFEALQTDVDGFLKIMEGAPKPPAPGLPASTP